jgi:hypothetical protein
MLTLSFSRGRKKVVDWDTEVQGPDGWVNSRNHCVECHPGRVWYYEVRLQLEIVD